MLDNSSSIWKVLEEANVAHTVMVQNKGFSNLYGYP